MRSTSAALHVAYRGSLEPQELSIEVETSGKAREPAGPAIVAAFLMAVNLGAAGSDDFPPSAGHAELVGGPWKEPESLGPRYHYVVRVAGVSPRFLRTLVDSLATIGHRGRRTTRVCLRGSLPCDGTALSVTQAQLQAWLDEGTGYVRRWPEVPFPLTFVDASGMEIRALAGGKVTAKVREAFEGVCLWWMNVVQDHPDTEGRPVDLAVPGRFPKVSRHQDELVASYAVFRHHRPPAVDVLVNMLVRFHETVVPLARVEIGR